MFPTHPANQDPRQQALHRLFGEHHSWLLERLRLRLNCREDAADMAAETFAQVVALPDPHPFGTLKQWMGATHFLTRKLAGVGAEMSLNVLAYNMKRVMKIIGAHGLMKALSA